jgi:hypothetical protein
MSSRTSSQIPAGGPKPTSAQSSSPSTDPSSRRRPHRSPSVEWSPRRDRHTSNLLYASLLMSLLAAFVAMLGKQWLNRYLRHTGGSMIERCGDRQRKFDGLEKWPFRFCMESLPIMLQIALLLLTCGLSRYVWSVNVSVGRVVISFTVLGVLFYIAVVVAGTSSYECPFQTPVSIGLRHLRDSETTRKLLASLFPQGLSRSPALPLEEYPTGPCFGHSQYGHEGGAPNHHHPSPDRSSFQERKAETGPRDPKVQAHRTTPNHCPSSPTVRHLASGLGFAARPRRSGTKPSFYFSGSIELSERKTETGPRVPGPALLLPTTIEDAHGQPPVTQNGPGLLVRVRNLESLRRRNTDNARCVSWVLRNITDPEAIDSDVRLAGTIRWFDGDSNHDPPFDLIVSAFEECFDATKQLYPGMRDRAYFSARAILQINMRARAPIP